MEIENREGLELLRMFEENVKKFHRDIEDENLIHIVLKAHLYIEYELEQLIKKYLPKPELLKIENLKFFQKYSLALAMGLIPESEKNILYSLNRLRNDLAHKIDFDINEKFFTERVIGQFGKRTRISYKMHLNYFTETYGEGLIGKMKSALTAIWLMVVERRMIPRDLWDVYIE